MSETPVRPATTPPMHAQHTDEVLRKLLGYDEDKINALKDSKVIA
jgi:crotonobetainyl-CoA:carnitine CoA-transferase CaiB-like acyl-CoA transferase